MNSTDILIYFAFAIIVYTHLSWATANDDQIMDYSDVLSTASGVPVYPQHVLSASKAKRQSC
jgi:hypothetical protein